MKQQVLLKSSGILFFSLIIFGFSSPKRDQRLKMKADRFFENFAYSKAVPVYEKVVAESDQLREESILKIADSYRLMNKPVSSEKWYEKLEGSSIMTNQDRMNYAQVLLKNGKDAQAEKIISQLNQEEIGMIKRLRGVENIEIFFQDSSAYFVENMNINSAESDFSPTFYESGIVFVSNRKNWRLNQSTYYWDDSYFLDLYYASANKEGVVTEPIALTKRINTIFHEGPAVFFDNDTKVIFTRNNFNLGEEHMSAEGINKLKLYYADKNKKGKWNKPSPVPFSDDNYSVGHPSITEDGKTMYFAADLPGTRGKGDIWRVEFLDGKWGTPENLGDQINTPENDLFPYISKDGILYFASEGHPGIGGLDIYKVDLNADDLTPVNMGYPVNTRNDDFGLVFDGEVGYLSSNRDGGRGNDDIYKYTVYQYNLITRLVDSRNGESLRGAIEVKNSYDDEQVTRSENVSDLEFTSLRGRSFLMTGDVPGYVTNTITFDTKVIPLNADEYIVDIPMTKINKKADILIVKNYGKHDQIFAIQPENVTGFSGTKDELVEKLRREYTDVVNTYLITGVNYDFDKYNVRDDSKEQLDLLAMILKQRSSLTVELSAHTDSRGSKTYNERLSRRRAQAAFEYLVANGIEASRIEIQYFGKSQPVACTGEDCAEEEHERNRRTEIRIIE